MSEVSKKHYLPHSKGILTRSNHENQDYNATSSTFSSRNNANRDLDEGSSTSGMPFVRDDSGKMAIMDIAPELLEYCYNVDGKVNLNYDVNSGDSDDDDDELIIRRRNTFSKRNDAEEYNKVLQSMSRELMEMNIKKHYEEEKEQQQQGQKQKSIATYPTFIKLRGTANRRGTMETTTMSDDSDDDFHNDHYYNYDDDDSDISEYYSSDDDEEEEVQYHGNSSFASNKAKDNRNKNKLRTSKVQPLLLDQYYTDELGIAPELVAYAIRTDNERLNNNCCDDDDTTTCSVNTDDDYDSDDDDDDELIQKRRQRVRFVRS